ncbi:hypothetical protein DITRI_Ditri10aG0152700 [Diplodiscus trichospermus]
MEDGESQVSIYNEDIAHRNAIIMKEADETWEVNTSLGINFDRDRNAMMKLFFNLEEDDISGIRVKGLGRSEKKKAVKKLIEKRKFNIVLLLDRFLVDPEFLLKYQGLLQKLLPRS